ncbi:MAG: hypothetical protein RI943_195 [Bacteroidota bacterium]|jgi:hypothetical protein
MSRLVNMLLVNKIKNPSRSNRDGFFFVNLNTIYIT